MTMIHSRTQRLIERLEAVLEAVPSRIRSAFNAADLLGPMPSASGRTLGQIVAEWRPTLTEADKNKASYVAGKMGDNATQFRFTLDKTYGAYAAAKVAFEVVKASGNDMKKAKREFAKEMSLPSPSLVSFARDKRDLSPAEAELLTRVHRDATSAVKLYNEAVRAVKG